MRRAKQPIAAVAQGLVAGAFGAAMQTVFFKVTSRITPRPPEGAFTPPDPQQKNELETETVARRVVTGLMRKQAPSRKSLAREGQAVHYGFGALWGVAYALMRDALAKKPAAGEVLGYGALVWMISDNLIVPAFKLAGWPQRYPLKSHAYALAAHFAYAGAVYVAYEGLRISGGSS
jgi:uncharacterized membrane protein YagU involved in acid resistance